MDEDKLTCENCNEATDINDWKEINYESHTTGYDGVRNWYQESYTLSCPLCNHEQYISNGWVYDPRDYDDHDNYDDES